jgi:hypothetical protein
VEGPKRAALSSDQPERRPEHLTVRTLLDPLGRHSAQPEIEKSHQQTADVAAAFYQRLNVGSKISADDSIVAAPAPPVTTTRPSASSVASKSNRGTCISVPAFHVPVAGS